MNKLRSSFKVTDGLIQTYKKMLDYDGTIRITETMAGFLKRKGLFKEEMENGRMLIVKTTKQEKIPYTNTPSNHSLFFSN